METPVTGLIALLSALALVVLITFGSLRWRRLAAREPRILLSGGGTGGHVNPALAIAEGIKNKEPNAKFLYVGVRGKAETIIVRRVGYPLLFVSSEGYPGLKLSWRSFRFLCRLCIGVSQSVIILFWFAPRWIIATGGYVSAPVILASLVLRLFRICPTTIFLHEQNSIPGQLNAVLGKWVDRVLLTFPQTVSFFPRNGVVVGYPIRHSITLVPREEAFSRLSFKVPEGRQVVFVFGGSQGARTINRAIVDALPHLLPHRHRLFIIHGMGLARSSDYHAVEDTESRIRSALKPEDQVLIEEFYFRQDYFHNIADVYSISDLIVCRSGAGSLNEISRMGKPAILIPKANLPGDHQVMNARAMKHAGAAEILFEDTIMENGRLLEKLEGKFLAERILRLLQDPDQIEKMAANTNRFLRRQAIERILSEIYRDNSFNNGIGCPPVPFRALFSNHRLLQILSTAYETSPRSYNPLAVIGDEDDLIYYRHRAAGLLSHQAWQDRNLGIKLIGLTHYKEKIPTLLHMLTDRSPTTRIRRIFGGDFEQVGFIRRNIVQALQVMNHFDADVEKALFTAADDPYYEVRAQVCRTAMHFGSAIAGRQVWMNTLLKKLDDDCFEVVLMAVGALGEVGIDGRALEALLNLKNSHYWQVRDAALKGLSRLVERRVISPSPDLLCRMAGFILTSTDFRPHFSIKETFNMIQKGCRDRLMIEEELDASRLPSEKAAGKS